MRNFLSSKKRLALTAAIVLSPLAAFAQTSGTTGSGGATVDLSAMTGSAQTALTSFVTTNGGALAGILGTALAVSIGWKLIKRGAKSV